MKIKHCEWCDNSFKTKIDYQIYCSAICRELATKQKLAERYLKVKREKRAKKPRHCKTCSKTLSFYNDEEICLSCNVNPSDVKDALKDIKEMLDE